MILEHLRDKHEAATALSRATWGAIAVGALSVAALPWVPHPLARLLFGSSAATMGGTAMALDRQKRKLAVVLRTAEAEEAIATIAAFRRELAPTRIEQALALTANDEPLPMAQWWGDVLGYPTVLFYGQFGSGKTTLAARLVHDRRAAGHRVRVLDPHLAAGAWPGCETVGSAMNYGAIDQALGDFADEVASRYQALAKDANATFQPITYICDEFTHWSDRTRKAAEFFAATMADTRKVKMFAVFVGHGRTLQCVGGKGGLAKTRDDSLLEVKLFAKPNPDTPTGVSPTGFGELKYPGNPEPVRVAIERWAPTPAIAATTASALPDVNPAHYVLEWDLDGAIESPHQTIARAEVKQDILETVINALDGRSDWLSLAQIKQLRRPLQRVDNDDLKSVLDAAVLMGDLERDETSAVPKYRRPNV